MIMRLSNMRDGFTLAEVLITLGIIGVVAAMTMPTLMNSTQGAQYKAAYKKALSALSQGVTLNVALDGGSFADVVAGTAGEVTEPSGGDSVASLLSKRMNIVNHTSTSPYTGGILGTNGSITDPDTFLFFNDGIMFAFKTADAVACIGKNDSGQEAKLCEGIIDVNGTKGPNKVVACNAGSNAVATAKDTVGDDGTVTPAEACSVNNPTDIYPVFFYDQTVTPATNAAKAVLYSK